MSYDPATVRAIVGCIRELPNVETGPRAVANVIENRFPIEAPACERCGGERVMFTGTGGYGNGYQPCDCAAETPAPEPSTDTRCEVCGENVDQIVGPCPRCPSTDTLRGLLEEAVPWLDHEADDGRELARRIEAALAATPAREDEGRQPPDSFWREVPCGHPQDPVAWRAAHGFVCHCGSGLDPEDGVAIDVAPGPVVLCQKCGCHVACVLTGEDEGR